MTRVINFTKIRYIMFAISIALIIGGIAGTVSRGGFNLGIDFQSGLNQRIQIAPVGINIAYDGRGDARLDVQSTFIAVEIRGEERVERFSFPFAEYPNLGGIARGLNEIEGVTAELVLPPSVDSALIVGGLSFPAELDTEPVSLNAANSNVDDFIGIERIRAALDDLGNPMVQMVGRDYLQEYLIRVQDSEGDRKDEYEAKITALLETAFGDGTVVLKQSDYVGPRFSRDLAEQSVLLTILALVLILAYLWFRFKLGYAISSITALAHDVLFMLGFIGTLGLEVSTTTIAAVLTIIGYSLNDTIVVFDRIRENTSLMKETDFETVVNTSITQSLSRTLITSGTTMIAVVALYIFGTGPIKDFALNLIFGIVVGTYSSIFIASPVLLGWHNQAEKRHRKKHPARQLADKVKEAKPSAAATEPKKEKAVVEIPKAERKMKGKRKKR